MNEWIIRQVANGYVVNRRGEPQAAERVFRTFAQASAWIKKQMEPVS